MNAALRWVAKSILSRFSGRQALFWAIERGNLGALQAALGAGASPNASGPEGVTALILASSLGHANLVAALLEAGADPTRATSEGYIAYDFARNGSHPELEALLSPGRRSSRPSERAAGSGTSCSSGTCRDRAHFLEESQLVLPRSGWTTLRMRMTDRLGPAAAAAAEVKLKESNYRALFEELFASESHATAHFAGDDFLRVRSPMLIGDYDVALAKRLGRDLVDVFAEKFATTDRLLWRILPDSLFRRPPTRACEIGGAWGATIKHVKSRFAIESYHNYEPDIHFARWTSERFGVERMPVDGETLGGTADDSVDLVIANNVLIFVPPIKIWSYLLEMRRVVRKDGILLFNLVLSDQLDESDMQNYLDGYFPKRTIQIFPRDILARAFPAGAFETFPVIDREYVVIRRTR